MADLAQNVLLMLSLLQFLKVAVELLMLVIWTRIFL